MNRLKKLCSLLIAFAMIVTMFSATIVVKADDLTQTIKLVAPDVAEINAGDEIEVPVVISDRNGLKGASFRVTWDPTLLTMSTEYNEDDDIYAAYPEVPALFNQAASINIGEGFFMIAGGRKNAFTSGGEEYSMGSLFFTVLDAAAGKDIELSFDLTKTVGNDGTGDKPFAAATGITLSVAGGAVEPEMSGITVTANAVEIADADKADTAKIEAAIRAAITSIKAQWTEGKEDTDVAVADVTIAVDTANNKAVVTYNGFDDEVSYTVAAPAIPDGALAQTIKLVAPSVAEIKAGDEIEVPVVLSDRNGLKGASFRVTWDPTLLTMSTEYNEDDDIYAAYPEVPALFNQAASINIGEGFFMIAGGRKSAFTSGGEEYSMGSLFFTVLDAAAGKDIELSFDLTKTVGNDGAGDKPFAAATGITLSVAGAAEPEIKYYTVIYKVDGVEVDKFENVAEGAAVPASTYVVPEGYTFSGWGEVPATVTGDLVIEGTTTKIELPDNGADTNDYAPVPGVGSTDIKVPLSDIEGTVIYSRGDFPAETYVSSSAKQLDSMIYQENGTSSVGVNDLVFSFGSQGWLKVKNALDAYVQANGEVPGEIHELTLDIKVSEGAVYLYPCFPSDNRDNNASLVINGSTLGSDAGASYGTIPANTWYRVKFTLDTTTRTIYTSVNGAVVYTGTFGGNSLYSALYQQSGGAKVSIDNIKYAVKEKPDDGADTTDYAPVPGVGNTDIEIPLSDIEGTVIYSNGNFPAETYVSSSAKQLDSMIYQENGTSRVGANGSVFSFGTQGWLKVKNALDAYVQANGEVPGAIHELTFNIKLSSGVAYIYPCFPSDNRDNNASLVLNGSTLGSDAGASYGTTPANTWYRVKFTLDTSTGTIYTSLNGAVVYTGTFGGNSLYSVLYQSTADSKVSIDNVKYVVKGEAFAPIPGIGSTDIKVPLSDVEGTVIYSNGEFPAETYVTDVLDQQLDSMIYQDKGASAVGTDGSNGSVFSFGKQGYLTINNALNAYIQENGNISGTIHELTLDIKVTNGLAYLYPCFPTDNRDNNASIVFRGVTLASDAGATYGQLPTGTWYRVKFTFDTTTNTIYASLNGAVVYKGTFGGNSLYSILYQSTEDSTVSIDNITYVVKGEAAPEIEYYTVTYKVNGEVVKEYTDVEEGSVTPTFDYTAPEGYTFSGWGTIPATVTEDLVIEGTTTINSYKVTYKVNGEVVNEVTVEYGATIPAYEYEAPEGYTFSGWDATVPATMPAEDLVFEGTTEEIPVNYFKVTFYVMGEVYAEIDVEEGTAIGDLMPEDPEVATYIFNGWFDGEGNPVDAEAVITGDIEVTADFTKDARDVNGDDVIDVNDAIYLLNHCALPELYPVDEYLDFDLDGDDVVNSKDAIALFNSIANPVLYSLR